MSHKRKLPSFARKTSACRTLLRNKNSLIKARPHLSLLPQISLKSLPMEVAISKGLRRIYKPPLMLITKQVHLLKKIIMMLTRWTDSININGDTH